jgi:hypothetical protein
LKNLFLSLIILSAVTANAQIEDSVYAALQKKPRPSFKFDSRNSFVSNRKTSVYGLMFGLDFGKSLNLGIGIHWLGDGNTKNYYSVDPTGVKDTIKANLKMNYFAYYAEQVFYNKKRWEFAALFRFGLGNSHYQYYEGSHLVKRDKRFVILYEPAITGSYKIFRWLGLGGDAGFRLMLKNNKAIPENFNSPTYALHLVIYFPELYRMIFKKKKKE